MFESTRLKKLLTYLLLVSGSLITFLGAAFIFMYVSEAIIARIGEGDQSLLFWYLPLLFIGVIGLLTGIAMIIGGVGRLKSDR